MGLGHKTNEHLRDANSGLENFQALTDSFSRNFVGRKFGNILIDLDRQIPQIEICIIKQ